MKKASKVHGKKYLAVSVNGLFGGKVLYSDTIEAFPAGVKENTRRDEARIWKAEGGLIYRVGLNGHKIR